MKRRSKQKRLRSTSSFLLLHVAPHKLSKAWHLVGRLDVDQWCSAPPEFALDQCHPGLKLLSYSRRVPVTKGGRGCVPSLEGIMKLLRTTALTAALMTAAVPLLTSEAQAWRWRGAGWRAAAVGAAVVGSAIAARSYYGYGYGYPAYGYGYGTGYSYPAYTGYSYPAYGYGTGYRYPAYGYGYGRGIVRRGLYAAAWRRWR